jgi:hypothetical protein
MRRNTMFWGLLLVLAGGLLLLSNLGILRANIWEILWPLFIILVGVWILFGTLFRRPMAVQHANVPLEGARRARVQVRHGAGRLEIRSGSNGSDLVEGDFGGGLDISKRREGDLLDVTLSVSSRNFPFLGWGPGESLDWSFWLAREIPITLDLQTGANESRVDLTDLLVSEVQLHSGASSTSLALPANAGYTRAKVETGAASVSIRIPEGVAGRIRSQSGLAAVTVDPVRFPRLGDYYESPEYGTASNKVELDIQTGVGTVDVR